MAEPLTQMGDHFSLAHFLRALEGFSPPAEPFDPLGEWENRYDIFECSQGMGRQGGLAIAREPARAGRAKLSIRYRKRASWGFVSCACELDCRDDDLSTPVRWSLETASLDAEGEPIDGLALSESGALQGKALEIRQLGETRRIPVEAPVAFHWALFDAVQRLSPDEQFVRQFTLIDRLSYQVKPGHTLAFRQRAEVELGGRKVWREEPEELEVGTVYRPVPAREGAVRTQVHAFEQFGEGVLPIVYWVDERGRLLLVLSGLIGYILNPEAEI